MTWQLGAQPPTLLASDTSETVAVPLREPAVAVFMPTCSEVLSVAPGASRLKLPLAVSGGAALMLAFRAACGGTVAWLVTLTNAVGEVTADPHVAQCDGWRVDHRARGVDDRGRDGAADSVVGGADTERAEPVARHR